MARISKVFSLGTKWLILLVILRILLLHPMQFSFSNNCCYEYIYMIVNC